MTRPGDTRLVQRSCPLCEALCGLELTVTDDVITRAIGDREHVLSHGYLCPKGAALPRVWSDPDRLDGPLIRTGEQWQSVSWPAAFEFVHQRLARFRQQFDPASLAIYVGNAAGHNIAGGYYAKTVIKALRTRHVYTAASADVMPKHVACGYLFGDPFAIPVPDLDRTQHLLILGANPAESNGSLCSAPDFRGRIKAIRARGGVVVVIDPRRTRTAKLADEYVPVRPGGDAALLMAMVRVLFDEDLVELGHLGEWTEGVERVEVLSRDFRPEDVQAACGVEPQVIRRLARDLAAAETAAVYGRIGTATTPFGTVTSWLIDVLNVLTGNLDRPGGAMFPLPPNRPKVTSGTRNAFRAGRWFSRVRGLPEVLGELPCTTMAEEMLTPGEGQIHGLITVGGNPALSVPNSGHLDDALRSLDLVISVDPYLNETTRHADVILPPPSASQAAHFDSYFFNFAVRNFVAFSPPVFTPDADRPSEVEILARLALILAGAAPDVDTNVLHERLLADELTPATAAADSPVAGRSIADLRALLTGERPEDQVIDAQLRLGSYGDGFGADPGGLSLAAVLAHPHGIDLGPLQPRLADILRLPRIQLCPPVIADDVTRLRGSLTARRPRLQLIGRRTLRSNNSWMHNVPALNKGAPTCTLVMNPSDGQQAGIADGSYARVSSPTGSVVALVELTEDIVRGAVCLPHGWGHNRAGTRMHTAAARPGVNVNDILDDLLVDPLSGNAVLNAIVVEVQPAPDRD